MLIVASVFVSNKFIVVSAISCFLGKKIVLYLHRHKYDIGEYKQYWIY